MTPAHGDKDHLRHRSTERTAGSKPVSSYPGARFQVRSGLPLTADISPAAESAVGMGHGPLCANRRNQTPFAGPIRAGCAYYPWVNCCKIC